MAMTVLMPMAIQQKAVLVSQQDELQRCWSDSKQESP